MTNNNPTKFEDLVSKVTFHSDTPEDIAQEILQWVKKAEPVILQKKGAFHKPTTTIRKKYR